MVHGLQSALTAVVFRSSTRPHAIALAILGGRAVTAQDKYTVKVPDGFAFSEFRGCESWQVVRQSTDELLNVILANPVMIKAYQVGIPATASLFRRLQEREDPMPASGSPLRSRRAGGQRLHGKAASAPARESPRQWMDARDAPPFQQQRHPGARGLIGSRADEHQLGIARDLKVTGFEFVGGQAKGARDRVRDLGSVERGPQVDDEGRLARRELGTEVFGRDASDAQLSEETLALDVLDRDVTDETATRSTIAPSPSCESHAVTSSRTSRRR